MNKPPIDIREIEPARTSGDAAQLAIADPALLIDILNTMPGRAGFIDTSFRYRLVNQEFLDFLGKRADQVLDHTVSEILGAAVFDSYRPVLERILAGEAFRWEGWADYAGYGKRYVQETLTPHRREGVGPVLGFIGVQRDLTELRQREFDLAEQLRLRTENDALHKSVVSTALDCIIIVDADGRVVDFNPAAEKLFGYSASFAIGQEISSLIVPEKYQTAHRMGMARYLQTGKAEVVGKKIELEAVTKGGNLIPVEIALADVSLNETRYFTAHIRDLTAQKKAEAEIVRQREAIYQKEKLAALGSLLSGVAHELNNPLAIVIGQAMMLRETVENAGTNAVPAEPLANRTTKIETAANRCAKIVKTFLAMARQRKAERTHVSIAGVISDAIELLSYGLKTSGVTTSLDIAGDIPGTSADADLLHQVIVNLVVNARQALEGLPQQDRAITLSARWLSDENVIEIRIRDNGQGIAPAIRNRIFDPFFTTKPQDHGTGIGLAVSRGLVETHGGTLALSEPQPAKGAEFVIRLPVLAPEAGNSNDAAPEVPADAAMARKTILIVDDESEIAELISEMAGTLGYQTLISNSGNAAATLLADKSLGVDAILCDIRMPDGDGPSLYDWLSANRPSLVSRIGFVTGDTLGPSAGRFLARTGCPVIEKPFVRADITRVVDSLVQAAE